jgi:hypothetical protein
VTFHKDFREGTQRGVSDTNEKHRKKDRQRECHQTCHLELLVETGQLTSIHSRKLIIGISTGCIKWHSGVPSVLNNPLL